MTTVHLVRGLYLAVSLAVGIAAACRGIRVLNRDGWVASSLAAYAIATAAAQATAFNKPLTAGTAYVGVGVLGGACWLVAFAFDKKRGTP